jgi:hypothetical protein
MFTSCEEDEVQEWELLKFSENNSEVYNLTYSGGEGPTYQIRTNGKWEISSDADWVTFSQTSGTGDATITTTLDKNTSTDNRYANIWIRGGEFNESSNIAGFYNHNKDNHSTYSFTQPTYSDYVSRYVSIDNFTAKVTGTYLKENSSYVYDGYVEFDIVNKGDVELILNSGSTEIIIDGSIYSGLTLTKEFTPVWGKNRVEFSTSYHRAYYSISEICPNFNVSEGELTKTKWVRYVKGISISRFGY